jgi:hypothetical protein
MKVYTLESKVNLADTSRDPDQINITKLGIYKSLESAKSEALKYRDKHFFQKDASFYKDKSGKIYLSDSCSWAVTLIISEEEVKKLIR